VNGEEPEQDVEIKKHEQELPDLVDQPFLYTVTPLRVNEVQASLPTGMRWIGHLWPSPPAIPN
jgi:hypothetical protein